MRARGDLEHHSAIGRVRFILAEYDIGILSPGPGGTPRTIAAAVSSQLVSIPKRVRALSVMGRSSTPKPPCGKGIAGQHEVLVTRPAEDGAQTAAQLEAMGHQAMLAPLLTTHFIDGPAPVLDDVQALLATSANGVRAFARLSPRTTCRFMPSARKPPKLHRRRDLHRVRNAGGDARAPWQGRRRALGRTREGRPAAMSRARRAPGFWPRPWPGKRIFDLRKAVLYRVDAADIMPLQVACSHGACARAPSMRRCSIRRAVPRCLPPWRHGTNIPVGGVIAACISPATSAALAADDRLRLGFAAIRVAARPPIRRPCWPAFPPETRP